MSTLSTRLRATAVTLAVGAGALAVAAPAHASGGDRGVERQGACSAGAVWKLKAKHDDGLIEAEFEVDSNRVGQLWTGPPLRQRCARVPRPPPDARPERVVQRRTAHPQPGRHRHDPGRRPEPQDRPALRRHRQHLTRLRSLDPPGQPKAVRAAGARLGRLTPPMPDGDQRDAAAGSRIVIVAVLQFAVVGLLALAIVAITTGIASRRVGQREAIANARTTTVLKAQSVVAPAITEGVRRGDPEALAELDRVVREEVLDDEIVRVKLWDSGGRIVYSDAPELIGSTYELGADDLEALQEGRIEAEVSDLSEPENRFERQYGKLLEVYLPIGDDPDDALLFEAYHRYEAVNAAGSQLWRSFAPIALGGLIVLELVQIPLAYSLARRLRDRMREREALTRRALEASEIERRQIASDLHDGVVQDLTGVAYALSAAARRGSGALPEAEVEAAATTVRDAVRDLRSMVVDLVPMSVDEGGLTAALEELAQRMSSDELTISVAADELPGTAPKATARVLYRAAHEGLRNAVRHADAAAVAVRLACDDGHAVLEIADDGKGFDPATLGERAIEGHVGLRALRGLVADSGGSLELSSRVGAGTSLRIEVPVT